MIDEQKGVVGDLEGATADRNIEEWIEKELQAKYSALNRALATGKIKTPAQAPVQGLKQDPEVQKMFQRAFEALDRVQEDARFGPA